MASCAFPHALADAVHDLQHGLADFFHPVPPPFAGGAAGRQGQFEHIALATDRLLPISRTDASGTRCIFLEAGCAPVPYIAYDRTCAGRPVKTWPITPGPPTSSAWWNAIRPMPTTSNVRKGLGVSWLPWSVVHADVKIRPAGPGRR